MYLRPFLLDITFYFKSEVLAIKFLETASACFFSRFPQNLPSHWNINAFVLRLEHSAHRNYISHFLSPFFTWVNVRVACRKAISSTLPTFVSTFTSTSTLSPPSSSLLRLSFRVPTTILSTAEAKDMKAAATAAANTEYPSPQLRQQQPYLDLIPTQQLLENHHHHHRRLVENSRSSSTSDISGSSSLFTLRSPRPGPFSFSLFLHNAASSVSELPFVLLHLFPYAPNPRRRSVAQEQDVRGYSQS